MSNEKQSGGIGFLSLLLLAFIVLKLCKIIGWSWWWVMAPLWIPAVIGIIATILYIWLQYRELRDNKKRPSKWEQRRRDMMEQTRLYKEQNANKI